MRFQRTTRAWWLPLLAVAAGCTADASAPNDAQSPASPTGTPTATTPQPNASGPATNTSTTTAPTTTNPRGSSSTATPAAQAPAAATSNSTSNTAGAAAPAAVNTPTSGAAGAISAECQGFKLEGLMHSPGGEVLPNKCMPYHPTTNNPYAVRCTDAWPWYKTQFPGDNFCILPPPPDKGVQYGVHPQGKQWFAQVSTGDLSGYDNLSEEWTMKDGEEESANYETAAPNPTEAKYYRSYTRMRPGSHHMIVNSDPAKPGNDTWVPVSAGGLLEGASGLLGGAVALPGAQRPDENRPQPLKKPDEDSGLYSVFPASAKVTFNMHHFNATSGTILKEVWTNLWWEDDARIQMHTMKGLDVTQVFTMNIPPGATQDLHYSWTISQPIRVMEAFGHRHAWTSNFSAWVENPDGQTEIMYQSFDWMDEPTYRYDSITQNAKPAPENRVDGASSGVRMLMPGQKLHFNCHIEYTDARAATEKAPRPAEIGALRFANEAFTAEMCILFGATAAVEIGPPTADNTPLPDFATLD